MKKIGFLILFSLFLIGCNRNVTVENPIMNSGNKLPQIQTGKEEVSKNDKTKQETKATLNIESLEKEALVSEVVISHYENKKGNFSLDFSSFRSFQENLGSSLVVFSREGLSGSDKAQLSISQLAISPDSESKLSLEEYYNQNKLSIRDVIDDFTEISQKKSKLDGNQSLEVIYKGQKNNQNFQVKQIFFQKSDMIFIITYLASESIFANYLPETDLIIKSIKIN